MDGQYTLQVSPNATLEVSYLGYATQTVAVKNQSSINVLLRSDDSALDEVVIVGASMKKSDLTGAVGSVSAKVLAEKPVTSLNEALQGRVAGVLISNAARPDQEGAIKIRGINTINGSTDPIYVVDGLVMDNFGGGFNSVNLNDIASIEILKDASSTALYGSRASNGVVLITTKKGKAGEGRISYDGWFGVRSYANTPEKMNSRQLFELRRDAAINGFTATHPNATDAELQTFITDRVMTAYKQNAAVGENVGFVFGQYELDAYADPNFKDYDWLDEVTRNGTEQNHTVSFAGGSDKGSYYLSFGYSNRQGMIKNLSNQQYNGRINAEQNIKPWLKVGTNTSFNHTVAEIMADDGVFDGARGANPMLPIDYDVLELNWANKPTEGNYFNPLRSMSIENDRERNRLVSANFLNINPIEGLNIRTSYSLNMLEEMRFRYVPNDIQQAIRYTHEGENTHTRDHRLNWQWDNSITYDTSFGDHRINALLGTSASKIDRNYTEARGRGYDTNMLSYYNLGASYFTATREIGSDFTASTLLSYLARANYNYKSKYYLTATARYDGSSKFAKGNQWGFFPSFSAAWNIAEEDFMKSQDIFNQLKVRAGFGLVGNQAIDDYAFMTLYRPQVTEGNTVYNPGNRRGTQNITWEAQQQSNIGFDAAFLNSRLRVSADAFLINNKNLLMTHDINVTSGFKEAVENIGAIQNKGVELTVDYKVIDIQDLQWNVSANISADRNEVTKLYGENDAIYNIDGDRNLQKEGNLFIGESRNTIYIWRTGGIAQEVDAGLTGMNWNGRKVNPGDLYPLDVSGANGTPDGKIDDLDRVIVGSPDPKCYGGFATDVTYKGISLNAVFNYSYGGKKLSYLYESMTGSTGTGLASVDLLDRWSPSNTTAKFPRPIINDPMGTSYNTFSGSQMDFSVQDASFLRMSALTLAYTLPKNIVSDLKLSNLRVYATGSNLFCLTPYKGYDPETGDWYPPTRMFVFGVNISF
ncbi:SusC/RagA family TonB-linked outer membrane protein [Bacteroidia bacterium]|nr:SusC/RagA family TonB-linked outer membrane protein [Bacteroidia bacterium]